MRSYILCLITAAVAIAARGEVSDKKPLREDFDFTVVRDESPQKQSVCFRVAILNKTDLRLRCDFDSVTTRLKVFPKSTTPRNEGGIEGSVAPTTIKPHSGESRLVCVPNSPEVQSPEARLQFECILIVNFVDENGKLLSSQANAIILSGDVRLSSEKGP
jgi:hypothetical protein